MSGSLPELEYYPLTPERWPDLEALFGKRGGDGGCWCMWWRLTSAQFYAQQGEENRRAFKAIVDAGEVPGLLAYAAGRAVAWCSVGPRERFPKLDRSPKLKRIDDQPVWSVVCFFVAKPFRRRGIMVPLLRTAVAYAKEHGAKIVEGYPIEPRESLSGASGYTGLVPTFQQIGFVEVLRRSEDRPIMRFFVGER